jgi:DNA-binding transcriptional LysR family regulator
VTAGADYLIRRLRLRHLELLVALAEKGTLRGAASQLHLSQPALSKMLNEIEAGFGARLFERSHQGAQANPLGAAAVHRARVILSEVARAKDEIDALRAGASAVLRLGAPSVTATIPAAIVQLRARMPAASVRIREGRVRELIQRLLDGELDCVFGAVTPELLSSDLLQFLQSQVLFKDQLCVLAARSNRALRRRGLRWADLRSAPWVAPPRDTLVRQAFMTAFLNAGLAPPEPVIEATSSVTVGTVLRMDPSLLCAVRFEQARDEVTRGDVRRVAVSPAVPLPSLGLFTRREAIGQPAVVQEFARAIRRVGAGSASKQHRTDEA